MIFFTFCIILIFHKQYGPGGMVAAGGPHGPIMQMPPGTAMPIPYGMVPQQQQQHPQIGPSSVNAVTTPVKAQEEEPPKKRKRISKKQQQKVGMAEKKKYLFINFYGFFKF